MSVHFYASITSIPQTGYECEPSLAFPLKWQQLVQRMTIFFWSDRALVCPFHESTLKQTKHTVTSCSWNDKNSQIFYYHWLIGCWKNKIEPPLNLFFLRFIEYAIATSLFWFLLCLAEPFAIINFSQDVPFVGNPVFFHQPSNGKWRLLKRGWISDCSTQWMADLLIELASIWLDLILPGNRSMSM